MFDLLYPEIREYAEKCRKAREEKERLKSLMQYDEKQLSKLRKAINSLPDETRIFLYNTTIGDEEDYENFPQILDASGCSSKYAFHDACDHITVINSLDDPSNPMLKADMAKEVANDAEEIIDSMPEWEYCCPKVRTILPALKQTIKTRRIENA